MAAIAIVLLIVIAAVIIIVIFATGSGDDERSRLKFGKKICNNSITPILLGFAWSYWSSWSSCRNSSLTSRTRFCVSGSTSDSDDERESADCPGADRETKECGRIMRGKPDCDLGSFTSSNQYTHSLPGACPASHPYTYGLGEMCCIGFYENLNDIGKKSSFKTTKHNSSSIQQSCPFIRVPVYLYR